MASFKLTFPCPFFFQQWKVFTPLSRLVSTISCFPLQKIVLLSEIPASSAAIATNGFIVDPGGYWFEIDLLISGLYLSLFNFSQFDFEIVFENTISNSIY